MIEEEKTNEQRFAENEAIFRRANEQLRLRYAELGLEIELLPFICECANERCTRTVVLTLEEYHDVRRDPQRYVIVTGCTSWGRRKICPCLDHAIIRECTILSIHPLRVR